MLTGALTALSMPISAENRYFHLEQETGARGPGSGRRCARSAPCRSRGWRPNGGRRYPRGGAGRGRPGRRGGPGGRRGGGRQR